MGIMGKRKVKGGQMKAEYTTGERRHCLMSSRSDVSTPGKCTDGSGEVLSASWETVVA